MIPLLSLRGRLRPAETIFSLLSLGGAEIPRLRFGTGSAISVEDGGDYVHRCSGRVYPRLMVC